MANILRNNKTIFNDEFLICYTFSRNLSVSLRTEYRIQCSDRNSISSEYRYCIHKLFRYNGSSEKLIETVDNFSDWILKTEFYCIEQINIILRKKNVQEMSSLGKKNREVIKICLTFLTN